MNVVVDAGNTRMKYAFFDDDRFVEARYCADGLEQEVVKRKNAGTRIHLLLSGSGRIPEEMRLRLRAVADAFWEASSAMDLPLKIGYATPGTLGFDRIAVCTGAMKLFPGHPLLVIDSGTCITFNYVDASGVFLGGTISPGLELRFKSLHQHTARLPQVAPEMEYGGVGTTTEEAIRNGVMEGMLFEVESYIRRFRERERAAEIVITGGNARFLENHLSADARFCDILGFIGLNEILQYAKKCD